MTNKTTRKYFFPALSVKIFGALVLGFIYQYYYQGGDTYNYYYWGSKWVWEAFLDSPIQALEIIFGSSETHNPELYQYTSRMIFYDTGGAGFVSRVAGFFALFTANTYSTIAIFFALISFMGSWYLFSILSYYHTPRTRYIAIALFFLPSIILWGSGLLKDTLTLGGVCFIVGALIRLIADNRFKATHLSYMILGLYILFMTKIYVLFCLIPCAGIMIFQNFKVQIKPRPLRIILGPILIGTAVLVSAFGINFVNKGGKYSLDNLIETAEATAWWHGYVSQEESGAGYTLGDYDYSAGGIVKKIIPAINVTLFRPYPWEVKSVFMLFSSFESLIFLILTVYVMFKVRFKDLYKRLSHPLILSLTVFSLTFAFAIGAVTYNFGALVRYKVPILPLYLIVLILLAWKEMPENLKK
ncbi:hypothetical protein [Ekhidna sp.]|uniref:hypothetical protein n=1 Tax=Ekhidna sp. TaxID=2608089 RepID=UPI003298B75B